MPPQDGDFSQNCPLNTIEGQGGISLGYWAHVCIGNVSFSWAVEGCGQGGIVREGSCYVSDTLFLSSFLTGALYERVMQPFMSVSLSLRLANIADGMDNADKRPVGSGQPVSGHNTALVCHDSSH